MPQLIFISHLPLLRMEREMDWQLGPDSFLTNLRWEQFDTLTAGAFSSWRPKYEQAAPVFLWYQEETDWDIVQPGPVDAVGELAVRSAEGAQRIGLFEHDLVWGLHEHVTDPVWAALALAAPAGVAAPPRSSISFLVPAGGQHHLQVSTGSVRHLSVRGDAGLELAFLPDAAAAPLDDATLELADERIDLAHAALDHPELGVALRQLLRTGDITLAPFERTLLAVTALDDLLVPESEGANAATLARRAGNLLGLDEDGRDRVERLTRTLYRHRSRLVHGEEPSTGEPAGAHASAAQLLAGAIEGLMILGPSDGNLGPLLASLDVDPAPTPPRRPLPLETPPGRAPDHRIGPREAWSSATVSSGVTLRAPDGAIAGWAPLVGLAVPDDLNRHPALPVQLLTVPWSTVVAMEDKDVRRDFLAELHGHDGELAVLAVLAARPEHGIDDAVERRLATVRNLAVAGLRLAGADAFIDPELLGTYTYDGVDRHRRETVLRQSVLTALRGCDPMMLKGPLTDRLDAAWTLLGAYADMRDDALDEVLTTLRRVHDRRYLAPQGRALLAVSTIELLLGGFRSPGSPVRPEALAAALDDLDPESADWFSAEGFRFRNAIAHAPWTPEPVPTPELWRRDLPELSHLLAVLRAATTAVLHVWMDADPPQRARHGAARLLQRALRDRIEAT